MNAAPAIRLREYAPSDREACLAIFDSNVPELVRPEERGAFAQFLTSAGSGDSRFAVVESPDGEVIACGGLIFDRGKGVASLCWGMVGKSHLKLGIGRYFLFSRLLWLRDEPEVAHVLATTSRHSASFYSQIGFSIFDIQPDYFGPDSPLYSMKLPVEASSFEDFEAKLNVLNVRI